LNLRKIAMEGANVIYKRAHAVWKKKLFFRLLLFSIDLDGFDENSKSLLFSQHLGIGQSDCHRSYQVNK
jgi:hypothetical protein